MSNLIYFLDDEVFLGEIFKEFMEAKGFEVEIFNHPTDAIKACNEKSPDIMCIDYRLPDMTGEEVALSTSPNIKKILLTGELALSLSYPFKKVILKPYKLQELALLLFELVEQ